MALELVCDSGPSPQRFYFETARCHACGGGEVMAFVRSYAQQKERESAYCQPCWLEIVVNRMPFERRAKNAKD